MVTKDEIFKKIREVLHETFEIPVEKIKAESRIFEDLDLDSIDALDLIVKLQNFTNRKIAPEVFKLVRTVDDVVNAIYDIIAEGGGPQT
jgi:acyl carrier protein